MKRRVKPTPPLPPPPKKKGKTMGYRSDEGRRHHHGHDEECDRREALVLQERIAVALERAADSWEKIAALMAADGTAPVTAEKLDFEAKPPVPE